MGSHHHAARSELFKRRHITLRSEIDPVRHPNRPKLPDRSVEPCTVLVINSGTEMAKEMTMQITLAMPGASIMYAPTLDLARWIICRRRIDLIVSSPLLPDGGIQRLKPHLEQMSSPPDLVVVGSLSVRNAELIDSGRYEFASWRRLGTRKVDSPPPTVEEHPRKKQQVAELGADLRNDLNNPLQEIVAMVFVARATGDASPATAQALDAIDRAAKNMASVVKGLEGKIREVVEPA